MLDLNSSESMFVKIYEDIKDKIEHIKSEEDAKIQLINRILTECLNWRHTDISSENKHDTGYSDYMLLNNQQPVLIIEAKRIGIIDVDISKKMDMQYLKISGAALKNALPGIEQAASYALPSGLSIAVLTDGVIWIIFKTFIPNENYKLKEAIVFPSLDSILSNYSKFYELLSKNNFNNRVYSIIFDDIHHKRLILAQKLCSPFEDNDIKLQRKSTLAFDLEKVFDNFFDQISGNGDEQLLIECFVESRESRIADFSLAKMTANVLGNIDSQDKNVDIELSYLIERSVDTDYESGHGQTIFIVGPTGAGKSTFLRRFFSQTLSKSVRDRCLLININCLDATGREDTALNWMTESIISNLEKDLYENSCPTWDDLLGLYFKEYQRRSHGVDAALYKSDKTAFKIEFGKYLSSQVETDREGYLRRILVDAIKNRKKLPIIVLDNTDEFTLNFKEQLFQFTQAIKRHINHCLIIFPVTDKSAWTFSKTDIFGIYQSRSFFLPTPSPREVFSKRIDYLSKKVKEQKNGIDNKREYFSQKGIKISIQDIESFAKILEDIFVEHDYTSKLLGELTNYNIRRTLFLSHRVITSPIIKIEDLVKSFSVNNQTITFTKFVDSLIRGDYEIHKIGDIPEIHPIFQVDSSISQSPLLQLRILSLLRSVYYSGRTIEEKHLNVESIISYFEAIGCSEIAVDKALQTLLSAKLIELYDVSSIDLSSKQKLAISFKGLAHIKLATKNNVFFYQMALTTPILDEDTIIKIQNFYKDSNLNFLSKLNHIKKTFLDYLIEQDKFFVNIPSTSLEQYDNQKEIITYINNFGSLTDDLSNELNETLGEVYTEGFARKGIIAYVENYDDRKKFGFAKVEDIDISIFFHAERIYECAINFVAEGDVFFCDISRSNKGFQVDKIHDIEIDKNNIEITECRIVTLFPDRNYGFANVGESSKNVFFHISIFPEHKQNSLKEGYIFKAEVTPYNNREYFQVRKVININ